MSEDFTPDEIDIVKETVRERYGRPVAVEQADVELRLHPDDRELTERPALYWEDGNCHFVIVKLGKNRYRTQFYYRGHQQYGTGRDEYDDLHHCTVTVLQVQADHQAMEAGH